MTKLNMWQRLGIVLTAIWLVMGTLWLAGVQFETDYRSIGQAYEVCTSNANVADLWARCDKAKDESFAAENRSSVFGMAALFAAIVAAVVWAFAYLVLWTGKWVLAGRRHSD